MSVDVQSGNEDTGLDKLFKGKVLGDPWDDVMGYSSMEMKSRIILNKIY